MLKAMRSALLDRTNRAGREGAAERAEDGQEFAEPLTCSESSGSEAANDHILESSSNQNSTRSYQSDSSASGSSDDSAVLCGDRRHKPDPTWRFTQYGHRHVEQHRLSRKQTPGKQLADAKF